MGDGMPYALEKGPYLSVIEDFANSSPERMCAALRLLRQSTTIPELGVLASRTLDPDGQTSDQRFAHIHEDWYGKNPSGQRQPPYNSQTNPRTGYWVDWYGDSEAVVRQTMIRACELSLGLNHDEDCTIPPRRHWPVDLFWKCPQPWFECWVTWHQHGPGMHDGQVTVLASTPGHGHPLKNTPLRQNEPASGGYRLNPVAPEGPQGMWVVSQQYHKPRPVVTTEESGLGEWRFLTVGLGFQSIGEVVVVAPPEDEGGILPTPRPFQPPA